MKHDTLNGGPYHSPGDFNGSAPGGMWYPTGAGSAGCFTRTPEKSIDATEIIKLLIERFSDRKIEVYISHDGDVSIDIGEKICTDDRSFLTNPCTTGSFGGSISTTLNAKGGCGNDGP